MRHFVQLAFIGSALSAAVPAVSQANVIANFDDGNTTASVDGYVGKSAGAGSGSWTSAWTAVNAGTGTKCFITTDSTTGVITGTANSPTSGGGSYLHVTVREDTAATDGNGAMVGRAFDNTATGVRTTSPFTVSFDFHADVMPELKPSADKYYQFYGNPGIGSSGGSNTWVVRANANGTFSMLYNNNDGKGTLVDTLAGITFDTSHNYHIVVNILDPSQRMYNVSISDGTTTRTSNTERFRSTATDAGNGVMFGCFVNSVATGTKDYPFEVDSVTIAPVPEPATAMLGGTASLLLMARRSRRQ